MRVNRVRGLDGACDELFVGFHFYGRILMIGVACQPIGDATDFFAFFPVATKARERFDDSSRAEDIPCVEVHLQDIAAIPFDDLAIGGIKVA